MNNDIYLISALKTNKLQGQGQEIGSLADNGSPLCISTCIGMEYSVGSMGISPGQWVVDVIISYYILLQVTIGNYLLTSYSLETRCIRTESSRPPCIYMVEGVKENKTGSSYECDTTS